MPRAEFATFKTETASAAAPLPPASRAATSEGDLQETPELSVLLIEEDSVAAQRTRTQLDAIFGSSSASDWVSDRSEGIALLRENRHDVCLCADAAGGALAIVREAIATGSTVPIVVLTQNADTKANLEAIDAGAADSIPQAEATTAALERSICHALVRQHHLVQAHHEIAGLTGEKTRLNLLRDANHRFVENACHDFRSPLTVIKEFASIIAEGLAGDVNEEQAEFLGIILTRVDQLSQMVDGILDASRLESDLIGVKREEHDVAELVEKVRPTLEQAAAGRKVAIEFSIPPSLPKVFADAESIGRVIVNLGANACKYAGDAGKIEVWARYDAEAREVTVGVTDSGSGIAPEHVKIIFDRFQQIPDDAGKEKGGFGLGLHISSEFVRINFGVLSVESEPGKGSTFAFTLPIFDVNSLIPLHFNFLKTSRQSFQKVAIAVATAAADADSPALADAERLLNRQLRSYDLLLRLRAGTWLVCVACADSEVGPVGERILGAYAQSSRNRPDGPLPEVRFRQIGTWALSTRPEGIGDAIRGVTIPEGREIH